MQLELVKRTHPFVLEKMKIHYSKPKGFVGRNICYLVKYEENIYGVIVGGSATRFLPGRNEFLGIGLNNLNNVINNIFFHLEKVNGLYPTRNFTSQVIGMWRKQIREDWYSKYDDIICGYETLVELPRTGECYKRDGWTMVGQTKGFTCKRISGKSTDNWSGKRIWDTENLRPKLVFCKRV